MEKSEPPKKRQKIQKVLGDFFVKPEDGDPSMSKGDSVNPSAKDYSSTCKNTDSSKESVSEGPSSKSQATISDDCIQIWTKKQKDFFLSEYPWLFIEDGKLGCSTCKNVNSLAFLGTRGVHISQEWASAKIIVTGVKASAQKSLRNKIYKHSDSDAHKQAQNIITKKEKGEITQSLAVGNSRLRSTTEKCLRTAYHVAYGNRPMSDFPKLVQLQETNGTDLGIILRSRNSCTEMIECISDTMKQKLCKTIIDRKSNISVITDESTSLSKKSCLIVYIRAKVDEGDGEPHNIFLDLCELEAQNAESVFKSLIQTLAKHGFDHDYLSKHFVCFTSDGASVMLGKKSGVGVRLKKEFPQIMLWHCMSHRIELAVSDAIHSIDGFHHIEVLFEKIYSVYSTSAKHQREIVKISSDLDDEFKKVGRIFTIRWVASSYRAVNALWKSYAVLYQHFLHLSENKMIKANERAMYKGLIKKMTTQEFVEDLALVRDCLAQLSLLSETLQKRKVNCIMASRHIQWTVNSLSAIKKAVSDEKYSFSFIVSDEKSLSFKTVPLQKYMSRVNYVSFDKQRFVQALIDNLQARMILKDSDSYDVQKSLEIFTPEHLPEDLPIPWLKGEEQLVKLAERFYPSCDRAQHILASFREYCETPNRIPKPLRDLFVFGLLQTIPISSAECERGFSQMNLIISPVRTKLSVPHVASLLFITINGPPPHLWKGTEATTSWLKSHRSAIDTRAKSAVVESVHDMNDIQKLFL